METQAEFDARRAAGFAFRASPAGRQLIADGERALDALIAAQAEDDGAQDPRTPDGERTP